MVSGLLQKLKLPIILIALGVLTLGFACTGMIGHSSMHTSVESMDAVAITLADDQRCCNTSISKHIESWKGILLVVPRKMPDGLILFILGLMATLAVGLFRFRQPVSDHHFPSYRLYERDNPDLHLFNHLQLAFAQGILNPKIYQQTFASLVRV